MKEIYVFGAGASTASAGAPLGRDLGWDYCLQCCKLFEIGSNGKPKQNSIDERKEEFKNYIKFLEIVGKYYSEYKNEATKAIEDISEGATHLPPFFIDKKYCIDEILKIIQDNNDEESLKIIKKIIFEHISESILPYSNSNILYKNFLKILKSKSADNITIISFNFDTLLREDYEDDIYIDYLLNFDYIQRSGYKYNNNCLSVIKLHGSFDWGICSKCKKLVLFHWHLRRDSYDKEICRNCKNNLEPFVIIPHIKEENNRMLELWNVASKKIKGAEKITIIGYSFPDYDIEAKELFKNNINPNVEINVIDYVDKNEESKMKKDKIYQKFNKIFSNTNNIKVNLVGFENYLNNYERIKQ